jgi:hypothetical protein
MDTSRFNRLMELPIMNFEEKDGILYGSSRNAGFQLEWKEIPWSWTSEHTLTNAREYSKGFAHVVRALTLLGRRVCRFSFLRQAFHTGIQMLYISSEPTTREVSRVFIAKAVFSRYFLSW